MKEIFRKLRVLAWIVQTSADENDRQTATAELVPICAPTGYALFKNLGKAPTYPSFPLMGPSGQCSRSKKTAMSTRCPLAIPKSRRMSHTSQIGMKKLGSS